MRLLILVRFSMNKSRNWAKLEFVIPDILFEILDNPDREKPEVL
jgi:hypothetical protein